MLQNGTAHSISTVSLDVEAIVVFVTRIDTCVSKETYL